MTSEPSGISETSGHPEADPTRPLDRSYRALLDVPGLGRIVLSMQIARVAQSMVGVAIVLFVLGEYGSPILAGAVTFASIFPGLLVSPVAGALLDRHGRTRLIIADYLVALLALGLIGGLSIAGALPPPLLFAVATVSSLTLALSQTGLRSLFPILVPEHLWERVNAVDSNGYVVASILGPPMAAGLVAVFGGAVALIAIGLLHGVAAIAMIGAPDPRTDTPSTGRLLLDALEGLRYTWRNRTLRGLGFSIAVVNLSGGASSILVPLIVLQRLGLGEAAVGVVFAVSGVTGVVSALLVGRMDTRGREWALLVSPMLLTAPAVALLLPAAAATDPAVGIGLALASFGILGVLTGPLDVALFTIRQRRTDPAWTGRAFAVSMAFNYLGVPIGAALAGVIAAVSLEAAIVLSVSACVGGALLAALLVPREEAAPA